MKKNISSNRNFHALTMMKNLWKQPARGVLRKTVVKICSKFMAEHPCRSVILIKLLATAYFQNIFSKEYFWVAASESKE